MLAPLLVVAGPVVAGCQLSAATAILDDTGGDGQDDGDGTWGDDADGGTDDGDGGSNDGGAGDGGQLDPLATDDDGDGWSEEDGDCNDDDDSVHPAAVDDCDQFDSDCDGQVDEDAAADDPTEPNDSSAWRMGDLADGDQLQVLASLHNDDDVDLFRFDMEDSSWSIFELTVSVSNIPSGAQYRVELEHLDLGQVYLDQAGSGTISTSVSDTLIQDDGGTWEIRVSSEGGADCGRDYLVTVQLD